MLGNGLCYVHNERNGLPSACVAAGYVTEPCGKDVVTAAVGVIHIADCGTKQENTYCCTSGCVCVVLWDHRQCTEGSLSVSGNGYGQS